MSALAIPAIKPGGSIRDGERTPWRRAAAVVIALLIGMSGLLFPTGAQAAGLGTGFGNSPTGHLGSFIAESDGRAVYCLDSTAGNPIGLYTSGPTTVTSLTEYGGRALSDTELAQINYVLAKWGNSSDPRVTAAVQLVLWNIADSTYAGDDHWLELVPAGDRGAVIANKNAMQSEANANATTAAELQLAISMQDQYTGTLTVSMKPSNMSGSVSLTNATFEDGSTSKAVGPGSYTILGTPSSGAPSYKVTASGAYSGAGIGARVDLYETPGAQRLLAAGTPGSVTAKAESPLIELDFQPVIGTQVASRYVQEGDAFVDELMVETTGRGDWIVIDGAPVKLTAKGALYGPYDEQPQQSKEVPEGAPVAGTETVVLDQGVGTYASSGETKAPESGFYTWVWEIDKAEQGDAAKYIRDSFRDEFGRVSETHVTPFQPEAVSKSDARLAEPGNTVTDTITVSSSNGAWLKIDGQPIPVVFTGTAYQVPGAKPPTEQDGVPEDAVALGEVELTANGPGVYTSPGVEFPGPGFVTWVWEVRLDRQPEEYRPYIANDWADRYGIPVETTSVRWPAEVKSEVREYNVHLNGRAFDDITLSGFPDDHGEFQGDGYWEADVDVVEHVVYGPFASDKELTDDLDLESAPVLTELTTPARNGTYRLGFTDEDRIQPDKPGYYVVVSSFVGDDRVLPFRSSPADQYERFFVPPAPKHPKVEVRTQAQPEAWVGEDFSDTAYVSGDGVPEDAYLVFRAYGPFDAPPAKDGEGAPFFTSEQIPVNGPGEYNSGPTRVDRAGVVYWVETLYGPDDEILAEGYIGAPGESTVVKERSGSTPPDLAVTGAEDWILPAGLIALATTAAGGALLFGRRLAQRREEAGYIRDEDLVTGEQALDLLTEQTPDADTGTDTPPGMDR